MITTPPQEAKPNGGGGHSGLGMAGGGVRGSRAKPELELGAPPYPPQAADPHSPEGKDHERISWRLRPNFRIARTPSAGPMARTGNAQRQV